MTTTLLRKGRLVNSRPQRCHTFILALDREKALLQLVKNWLDEADDTIVRENDTPYTTPGASERMTQVWCKHKDRTHDLIDRLSYNTLVNHIDELGRGSCRRSRTEHDTLRSDAICMRHPICVLQLEPSVREQDQGMEELCDAFRKLTLNISAPSLKSLRDRIDTLTKRVTELYTRVLSLQADYLDMNFSIGEL